jgi:hypothetical protein
MIIHGVDNMHILIYLKYLIYASEKKMPFPFGTKLVKLI